MSLLKIKDLSIGYKSKTLFSSINLEENEGQLIALLGSNGRGKSTLLRTIATLSPPLAGEVFFNNRSSYAFSPKELSELVAFVSPKQERAEYLSVEQMLSINTYHRTDWLGTLTPREKIKIAEALQEVGMADFLHRECNSLSDGEYQRVTIAGALVQDSRIILLDEPTAFLDIANRYMVARMLKRISRSKNKLILFSTHDLSLALEVCDRLWVMTPDGLYSGTPETLTAGARSDGGAGCLLEKMFDVDGVWFNHKVNSFELRKDVGQTI